MWYIATSASVVSGEDVVEVLAGDDVSSISSGSALIFEDGSPVEVLEAYETTEGSFIKLASNWPYTTKSAQPLLVYPTSSGLAEATAALKLYLDNIQVASTIEAQSGTNDTKIMTALKTKQSIDFNTGTAAAADVTTSSTDTTAGRVTKVGDFGLGAVTQTETPDLNALVPSGLFSVRSGVTSNNPLSTYHSGVIRINSPFLGRGAELLATQSDGDNELLFRGQFGSNYSDWNKTYHSGNTNFNEFIFNQNETKNGLARNASEVIVELPLNSKADPSSITATGTFYVVNAITSATEATGVTPAIVGVSSQKNLIVSFTNSGAFTKGDPYTVVAESGGATIKANF